jgi:hypothetical protein
MDIEEVRKSGVGRRHTNPVSDLDRHTNDPCRSSKQHKEGGRLIVPLGSTVYFQTLTFATKRNDYSKIKQLSPVAFVPLVGEMQKERGIISREIAWVSVRI